MTYDISHITQHLDDERALYSGQRITPAREIRLLRKAIQDVWWMARRYCDGRSTYAASTYNQHTRNLLALGIELNPTGEEAAQGRPPEWLPPAEQRDYEQLRAELAALKATWGEA